MRIIITLMMVGHLVCAASLLFTKPKNDSLEYIFYNQNKPKNVMFLHGIGGSAANFYPLASNYLIKNEANIWSLSLRNHGNSFNDPVFTIKAMAEDIVKFISKHKIYNLDLVGYSIGGRVAMYIAANFPKYIDRLAIMDFMPFEYPEVLLAPGTLFLKALSTLDISNKTLDQIKVYLSQFFPLEDVLFTLNLIEGYGSNYQWTFNLPVLLASTPTLVNDPLPGKPFLKPTKFIFAKKSQYFMENRVPDLVKYFPRLNFAKDVTIVDNVDHNFPFKRPEIAFQFVYEFLKSK